MIKTRRKITAVFRDFNAEIRSLRKFDSNNHSNFQDGQINQKQLHLLCEAIFFRGFRDYENFTRDIFLLYSQEKVRSSGASVKSHLRPTSFLHAEKMIQSSMSFLDWNSPNTVIERAELFLRNGFPIKSAVSTNRVALTNYKRLRNQIAHNSTNSVKGYLKVLRTYYGVNPITIPSVGEYLCLTSKSDPNKYHLIEFFDTIENLSIQMK